MTASIAVPDGAEIGIFPSERRLGNWLVAIGPPGVSADQARRRVRKGGLSVAITHDPGAQWPDRAGCNLATGALSVGVPVVLIFRRRVDALACQAALVASDA